MTCVAKGTSTINAVGCDISQANQLWRVTRMNQGATGPSPPGQNTGLIAQILDRSSGLCLGAAGTQVSLGSCQTAGGFTWLLVPSLTDPLTGTVAPEQIVYLGGLKLPVINSLTDLFNFISTNNLSSLGISNGQVVALPYATDATNPSGKLQTSLPVDLALYNIIAQGGFSP